MNMLLNHYEIHHIKKFIDDLRNFHNYLFFNYPVVNPNDITDKDLVLETLGNYVKTLSIAIENFENKLLNLKDLENLTSNIKNSYKAFLKDHSELRAFFDINKENTKSLITAY